MAVEIPVEQSRRTGTRRRNGSLAWIYAWAIGSTLPLIPYATPLWSGALADTPYAYLVWIPVFAFTWAGWQLRRALSYNDDAELNGIMGIPMLLLAGSLLVAGISIWQYYFVGQSAGLLIWPLWALGLAWLVFGVGVTKYLIRPLAYLWLCWPPLYSSIVSITNPVLEDFANRFVTDLAHKFSWLAASSPVGVYLVMFHRQSVTVYVTSVCSGADSLLAVVILLPIVLVTFTGSLWKKSLSILFAAFLALLANWLRLAVIIFSIHVLGPNFSLGILHPVLGILLFIAMVASVVKFSHWLGLENRKFKKGQTIRTPGRVRVSMSILSVSALTVLLWPLYQGAPGTDHTPIPVASNVLPKLMPKVLGWSVNPIGNYDAASILGPGAVSTAVTYRSIYGDQVLSEWWWTYQPISLQGYTEHDCLLFHGAQIIDQRPLSIAPGITATVYTVLLAPAAIGSPRNLYLDTVYTYSVRYHGRVAFIRSETATPVAYFIHSSNPLVAAMPSALSMLLADRGSPPQTVGLLNTDQTIHLENYFSLVHGMARHIFRAPKAAPAPSKALNA